MDLPSCPACGQSVLDEVELCPFCGSSMSGKPVAGGQPQAAAPAPAKPKPKPAAAPTDPDDPFAEATAQAAKTKVIPLAPRAMENRPIEVKCPMCDTIGFAPQQASGRDVKCANKACTFPVFTAPSFGGPVSEETNEASERSLVPAIAIGLVLAAIASGAWWWMTRPDPTDGETVITDYNPETDDKTENKDPHGGTDPKKTAPKKTDPKIGPPPKKEPTAAERVVAALNEMPGLIRNVNERDGDARTEITRRTAVTFEVAAGWKGLPKTYRTKLDSTLKDQYQRLINLRRSEYHVFPLAARSLRFAESGSVAAAKKSIDQAEPLLKTPGLPHRSDATIRIAAACVAIDDYDRARNLIRQYRTGDLKDRMAAIELLQFALGDFRYEVVSDTLPVLDLDNAQDWGVTALVAARFPKKARAWVDRMSSSRAKGQCVVVLARVIAGRAAMKPTADRGNWKKSLDDAIAGFANEIKASALAQAALVFVDAGDKPTAERLLGEAKSLITAKNSAAVSLPIGVKQILDMQLPNNSETLLAQACAAFEIARVEALIGKTKEAVAGVKSAIAMAHSAGPSIIAVHAKQDDISNNRSRIEADLRSEYNLTLAQDINRKFDDLRNKLKACEAASVQRYRVIANALSALAGTPIAEDVWKTAKGLADDIDAAKREPLQWTRAAFRFGRVFQREKKTNLVSEVWGILRRDGGPQSRPSVTLKAAYDREKNNRGSQSARAKILNEALNAARMDDVARGVVVDLANNKAAAAATRIHDAIVPAELRQHLLCREVSKLVAAEKYETAFTMARERDRRRWLDERAISQFAAAAASRGKITKGFDLAKRIAIAAAQRAAFDEGMIYGLAVDK